MPNSASQITLLIVIQILVSLIMFSASVALLVFLLRKPVGKYKPVDLAIFKKLDFLVSARNSKFMLLVTFLGNHKFLIPANLSLIVYFLFIGHQSWFSVSVAAIALSSLVLMLLLKSLFKRRRPLAPLLGAVKGLSFPSGHAIMSVTFYGLIIFIITNTVSNDWTAAILVSFLIILILLIGFSRVYLRVHYASDVLAGFIIGLLWLFISLAVLRNIQSFIM